jgi:hypothetical protein
VLTQKINMGIQASRPVGQTIQIHDKVPGDINTRMTFKLALHREDTISNVIKAVESTKAELPADLFAGPWIGYSKLVSEITKTLFGTTDTDYPFYWTGDIKTNDIVSSDGQMKEHYIVLVSPRKDGDEEFRKLKKSKLVYDATEREVLYEGAPLTRWSHAVLRIAKTDPYRIDQLVFESTAPWAVLARSQFLTLPLSNVGDLKELNRISQNAVVQLKNEIELLNKEHRFSKFDRAVTLKNYTEFVIREINSYCEKRLKVPMDQCPVGELTQFSSSIVRSFGLQDTAALAEAVTENAQKIMSIVNSKLKGL